MKKLLGAVVSIALLAMPINAMAAVKAGDSCKKAGVTATTNGKKFTCVKSGKKLVWNKGITIAKPKPAEIPTPVPTVEPTPSASPTPTPTVIPAPVIEEAPTGFNDLVDRFKGVYVGVWKSTEAKIAAHQPVDVKQNI